MGVSSRRSLGLHRTVQLQLLRISGWGIDLDYCDFELFCLGNEQGSLLFENASKYCILDSSVDYEGYSIFLRDSCHSRSSELNLPFQSILVH